METFRGVRVASQPVALDHTFFPDQRRRWESDFWDNRKSFVDHVIGFLMPFLFWRIRSSFFEQLLVAQAIYSVSFLSQQLAIFFIWQNLLYWFSTELKLQKQLHEEVVQNLNVSLAFCLLSTSFKQNNFNNPCVFCSKWKSKLTEQ